MISNPAITGSRVAETILYVCGDKLGAEVKNLTQLLVENKRLALLPEIINLFEKLKAEQEGELTAHIISAFALTVEQMTALVEKLQVKLGRKITATQSIDSELIAGVIIQVGDEVMDASVRGGLQSLAVSLKV
jgi:F-type H+-transporting ATPase subunit delta